MRELAHLETAAVSGGSDLMDSWDFAKKPKKPSGPKDPGEVVVSVTRDRSISDLGSLFFDLDCQPALVAGTVTREVAEEVAKEAIRAALAAAIEAALAKDGASEVPAGFDINDPSLEEIVVIGCRDGLLGPVGANFQAWTIQFTTTYGAQHTRVFVDSDGNHVPDRSFVVNENGEWGEDTNGDTMADIQTTDWHFPTPPPRYVTLPDGSIVDTRNPFGRSVP